MRGVIWACALALAGCAWVPGRRAVAPAVTPLALSAGARVMVFAPHPDDETIAVGGLLHGLVRHGVPTRVVFVTNGDGYQWTLQKALAIPHPTDDDYLALGQRRQREALAATRRLGLPRSDVLFLGFPDNGLAALWHAHWSNRTPYTSPFTKEDRPPYPYSVNRHVEYAGQDLLSVISQVLHEFRPTVVIMPHPHDLHADHVHTGYFVTEAVTRLREHRDLPTAPTLLTYLVHYAGWPATEGPRGDLLIPLGAVADTQWTGLELGPADREAKRLALSEYRTQLGTMDGFLRSFLCRNELLATVDGRLLARIAAVH